MIRFPLAAQDTVHRGMGALPYAEGTAFRLWAPHARQVFVKGDFNDWSDTANALEQEGNGYWYGEVADAKVGQGYRFWLQTANGEVTRIDPYAGTDPAEFFAVASETFFTAPSLLQDDYPSVYDALREFYRQDPVTLLPAASP